MVGFLRGLFAQCPAGAYHWEPTNGSTQDQEGSELWIGTETPIDPEIVGKRPAIVIGRGPAAFHGVGLGDQAYVDLATGSHVKMDMVPVTININVLSKIPVEAEELAWFVARHIWNLRNEILRGNSFIMYTGQRPALSPPSAAGSLIGGPNVDSDWIVVTVSMPVYLQHMEVATPLNRKVVGEIVTVATTQGPRPAIRQTRALQGTAVNAVQQSSSTAALPQNDQSGAQSSEPLTVRFKI